MKSTFQVFSARLVRILICGLILLGFAGLAAQQSVAALFTLTDDNSVAHFDTASPANNDSWQVDGLSQLQQQAFWYRIGNVAEQSVHTLPIAIQGASDSNFDGNSDTLFVRYHDQGDTFRIETRYTLDGGAPGGGASDLAEQISITNLTAAPLDFHFFQYANFDLQGTPNFDSVVFTNVNAVQQFEGSAKLTETIVTPVPSHREVALLPVTLNKLNDGLPTTLSDTPLGTVVGPGDVTWAYQWDFQLQPGGTFQISKDKNLHAGLVPEPSAGALLILGTGALLAQRRKRKIA